MGTALHDSIEQSWRSNYKESLAALGYPQAVIDRIRINPTTALAGSLDVFMELREEKQVGNWRVVGKYDLILDGVLKDYKSTKTYTYINGNKRPAFKNQLSLYKWLNPKKATADHGDIVYLFKNWEQFETGKQNYPQSPIMEETIPLLSVSESDQYVRKKISDMEKYWDSPEIELPQCTPDELGQGAPSFKYYPNPANTTRASKVFTNPNEASLHQAKQGKGIVLTVFGTPYECTYCQGKSKCSQYASMVQSGLIKTA